jgi:hypothetical protein
MDRLILVFILGVTFVSCDDGSGPREPVAPPGTFQMKLDGMQRVASSEKIGPSAYWDADLGTIQIDAFFANDANPDLYSHFSILLYDAKAGRFDIRGGELIQNVSTVFYNSEFGYSYSAVFADGPLSGLVYIHQLDLVNKFVSGSFKVNLATSDKAQSHSITDGSFTEIPIK